ncbi:hypothetical protein Q9Q99_12950 [Curtobacterium flaccumfaciens]|nr:hypothetical protein Q9Q99_12950 [Curtobacterium flaccumfaciens]
MTRTFILRRPDRPRVVTVSFVLWLVWVVACIAATVLQFWRPDAAVDPAPVIAGIVALVLWALVTWAVFRTAAGSRVARIVLVVVAGFPRGPEHHRRTARRPDDRTVGRRRGPALPAHRAPVLRRTSGVEDRPRVRRDRRVGARAVPPRRILTARRRRTGPDAGGSTDGPGKPLETRPRKHERPRIPPGPFLFFAWCARGT